MGPERGDEEKGIAHNATEIPRLVSAAVNMENSQVKPLSSPSGTMIVSDDQQVSWDSSDDVKNPYNWPLPKKWMVTIFISLGGFICMMSGSMIAPALPALSYDLAMSESDASLSLSIFILAFAIGPMILAPFTEVYGRRSVWVVAGIFYSIWNVVCGFSDNRGMLIASRFLSGIGGAVDFVITSPVIKDIWPPEQRGYGLSIAYFIPLLGPALGPLVGGAITQHIGWRWLFWIPAIFNGALVLLCGIFFPETSGTRILHLKARELTRKTGQVHYTEFDVDKNGLRVAGQSLIDKLKMSLGRPMRMLLTQPILQVIAIPTSYNFGLVYYTLSSYASVYTKVYEQSPTTSGLHYIAIALGYIIANFVANPVMDWMWKVLKARAGGATAPEYRIPLTLPGGLLMPLGLIWYGWSAERRLSWIMTDAGAVIFGLGFITHTNATSAYILDSFEARYSASVFAAWQACRMLAGFVFPLFAPAMSDRLGWGWSNTLLGLIGVVFGFISPAILWIWGARIRAMGKPQW